MLYAVLLLLRVVYSWTRRVFNTRRSPRAPPGEGFVHGTYFHAALMTLKLHLRFVCLRVTVLPTCTKTQVLSDQLYERVSIVLRSHGLGHFSDLSSAEQITLLEEAHREIVSENNKASLILR